MSVQLALDTFVRANQSGFGTASDGNESWTARDATATYSIASNQGKVLQNSTNADEVNTLFSPTSNTAYEIYAQCTTSNATSHPGLIVNFQSTGNWVKCEISPTAVNVVRYVSNSQTTLKSDTSIKVTAANDTYNFRFRWEVGGAYYFKVWKNTSAEPAAWNCNGVTDATYNSGAVGVYVAARGATTDTVLWNQFYVSYSDLYEDTSVNSLGLVDASTTTVADSSEVYALSSPVETAAYVVNPVPVDALTEAETVTFALAETIAADTTTASDSITPAVTQTQTNALSAPTDSQAWVEVYVPTESQTETETVTFLIAETIAADSVSTTDSMSPSVKPSLTDSLTESEASSYALSESLAETALNEAETALYVVADTFTADQLSGSESSSYANTGAFSDTLTSAETDHTDQYYSVEEDMVSAESVIEVIIDTPNADTVTLAETKAFTITDKFPTISVSNSEITLTTVNQTDSNTAGSAGDSIVFGQPGVIFPDQLDIEESISIAQGPPLVDVALFPTDLLQWDTNFTDHCDIEESLQIDYASALLDARSVLYSNTISDGPSAYWQLNEDTFGGLYQRDGSDQPNNASIPILYGATLEYTWSMIEPQEGNRLFSTIDADILPWKNQGKKVILRVFVASTPLYNNTHNANTAGHATPSWVFSAGAPSVTGLDGAVYPVYWNATFLEKYKNFVNAFANYYDENSTIAGIVISCGVNGTTAIEASGDSQSNTVALWTPVGYSPAQWVSGVLGIIDIYQNAFQHTPLILSVNDGVILPDAVYNIHQFISLAVAEAVWLMDENIYLNEQHNDPNWNIVPLVTIPKVSIASGNTPDTLDQELTLAINYQADYAAVWAADVTLDNEPILTKYFNLAQSKGLNDSASSNFKMSIFGGVYPTSHISTGDYLNGAQQFDGLTGYGYIGQLAQTTTSAWTMKCTVFPTILPMEEAIAFSIGNDGSSGYGGYAIGVSGGVNGGVGAKFCAHLPGVGWLDSGYSFPEVGQWYTLFVTWDGFTLRFYANGVQTPKTYTQGANVPSLAMTIGAQWDGMTRTAKRFFIGSVDECAVYPFALDPSRILILSEIEYGTNELLSGTGSSLSFTEQLTVNDESSTTNDTFLSSDALTLSENFAYSVASSNVAGYEVLANDQFNRLVSNGLGTTTDGGTWVVEAGSSTLSVDGSVGQATGSTSTNILFVQENDTGETDTDPFENVSCMFELSATGDTFGVIAFGSDASNYYSLRYTSSLQLYKTVAGTSTPLGSAAAFTVSASTWYHLHLIVSEGILYGNIWADGSAEPVAWMVTATDTSLTSGSPGLYINSTSAGHVVNFDNFFAIDNLLSDYLLLQESYSLTAILPPLVDALSAPVDASTATVDLEWTEPTLSNTELITPTNKATGVDFLLFGNSAQAWNVNLAPTEPLTEQETIDTPVVVNIPPDAAPPLSDMLVPYITPVPVDQLASTETLAEDYSASLVDTPTLIDASTVTQVRTIVDLDPSVRYVTRAFGGTIKIVKTTPLIASDKIVPTDDPLEVSTLSTADSVSHGPAYILTEQSTVTESLRATISETVAADATAAPTDTLVPTIIPSPVDTLTENENIIFAVGPILPADVTGSVIEEDILAHIVQVAEDDSVSSESYVTDGPTLLQDFAIVTVEGISVTPAYLPLDTIAVTEVDVTGEAVTFPVVTVVSADAVTPTDIPLLQDTVVSSDGIDQVVSSQPLADTPVTTESILSIDLVNNTLVTLGNTELVTFTVNPQESNQFVEAEGYMLPLAETLVDSNTISETSLPVVIQAATDSVDIEEQTIATNGIFDGTDLNVFDEKLFDQEFLYNTDSTVSTDSVIAIETFIHFLPDQPTEASDGVSFTNIFVPVDQLEIDDSQNEAFAVQLADTPAPVSDLISDLQANSFTGWVDILSNTEFVAYGVVEKELDVHSLNESVVYYESATYQDSSTPQSELILITVEQDSTDSGVLSEVVTTSVTLPTTELVTLLDTSVTNVVALESTVLSISDTVMAISSLGLADTLIQVDASTVTTTTNEADTLLLDEVTAVTGIAVESDDTPVTEIFHPGNTVTTNDVTITVTDASTFVTITVPIEDTPVTEILVTTGSLDDAVTLTLNDVTTTTTVTVNENDLSNSEISRYVTVMAPIETVQEREVLLATGIAQISDVPLSELEVPAVGYTLFDTLNIVETLAATQQSYIKTFAIIRTGQADGIIRTGQAAGTMRTGLVDGVIP